MEALALEVTRDFVEEAGDVCRVVVECECVTGSPDESVMGLASFTLLCVAEMSAMAEGVRISPEEPRLSAEAREPMCGLL